MTSIYLVRHGQASFGEENYDQLSKLGEEQAKVLGQALSSRIKTIDQVYLGSMSRHKQTADICLNQFANFSGRDPLTKSAAIFQDDWNEYNHEEMLLMLTPEVNSIPELMSLLGKHSDPKGAFRKYFSDAIARWMSGSHDDDYSESWFTFLQRVNSALQHLIKENQGANNIVVFTSGGPISVLSQALLGVPKEQMMKMNWTLLNCGVTKVVVTPSASFLASLNEHTHFEGDQKKHLLTYT